MILGAAGLPSDGTAAAGADPMAIFASFRDPAGCVFTHDGRLYRIVTPAGMADLNSFLQSGAGRKWIESGRVVRTAMLAEDSSAGLLRVPEIRRLYDAIGGQAIVEHERIPFPSFPYEWAPEMLHAAGMLTLDLARDLLRDDVGLKDGTPYNVLFRGTEPVFIDLLSFERRDPADPTWVPYGQFVRTFLLPLLANLRFGLPLDQLLFTRRDGLEPEEVYRWASALQRISPGFLSLVSLPTWLASRHSQDDASIYRKKRLANPEKARFILETLINSTRRSLDRLRPKAGKTSVWSDYMESNNNYTSAHFAAKKGFVEEALATARCRNVLDVGCNTGFFSSLAARAGASVVAIDYDPVVVGEVWRQSRAEKLDILPLVVNLTRPTPGTGWLNREWSGFLDRARGRFDMVFMLAVIHHMLVTERVPLRDIIQLASELTTDALVVEFIAPDDSMFRRLTRGRDELHKDLTPALFEETCRPYFEIARTQHLENTSRWLYLLRRKPAK